MHMKKKTHILYFLLTLKSKKERTYFLVFRYYLYSAANTLFLFPRREFDPYDRGLIRKSNYACVTGRDTTGI